MSDKKSVLIVDDEADLLEVLGEHLAEAGYDVSTAHDGEEGLKKAVEIHPDLILLDVIMPKMDGVGMLRELRQDEWGKTAKVVFLTNSSELKNISASVEENVEGYILKSDWTMEEIVKKVKEKFAE